MPSHPVIRHLEHYVDECLRVQGHDESREYWRGCLLHWREHYGAEVAKHMARFVTGRYKGRAEVKPPA